MESILRAIDELGPCDDADNRYGRVEDKLIVDEDLRRCMEDAIACGWPSGLVAKLFAVKQLTLKQYRTRYNKTMYSPRAKADRAKIRKILTTMVPEAVPARYGLLPRDRARLYNLHKEGTPVAELAVIFDRHQRTILRYLGAAI